ncbi:hypothetical protein [Streptomyces clavuligerus]|uniref:Secreted protein n=1 Tax=Streptomyces clavuligerus TaxID=1901 RepID=B5GVD2_STRCL|nr:hypothetical protein [Streptomyces clavuligerus]ANW17979.1 hypothetical protein BB341_06980 [Streptomyces clavuligerus]AXU12540.1 hypothetical protein D1794_07255 [Streptomyces clavuligerus]EDY50278.1 hypothetical protein SSCG_03306 [Streptomyces clavuligerus]EFG09450.1 Hypothetical protein SCLAV_4379 [Streptomyces clavuligerus]MBY6302436.1 hypothetical protein [Streptomyces clavuligerus]
MSRTARLISAAGVTALLSLGLVTVAEAPGAPGVIGWDSVRAAGAGPAVIGWDSAPADKRVIGWD